MKGKGLGVYKHASINENFYKTLPEYQPRARCPQRGREARLAAA